MYEILQKNKTIYRKIQHETKIFLKFETEINQG